MNAQAQSHRETRPITIGVTLWFWQIGVWRTVKKLARIRGVELRLRLRFRNLMQWECVGDVSGRQPCVDAFVRDFVRLEC